MTLYLSFIISATISYLGHHFGEHFFSKRGTRNINLVFKGYQIHHSTWGALVIALAIIFASGVVASAMLGYGIGNIWQHKKTHNAAKEKGMIFISKAF